MGWNRISAWAQRDGYSIGGPDLRRGGRVGRTYIEAPVSSRVEHRAGSKAYRRTRRHAFRSGHRDSVPGDAGGTRGACPWASYRASLGSEQRGRRATPVPLAEPVRRLAERLGVTASPRGVRGDVVVSSPQGPTSLELRQELCQRGPDGSMSAARESRVLSFNPRYSFQVVSTCLRVRAP